MASAGALASGFATTAGGAASAVANVGHSRCCLRSINYQELAMYEITIKRKRTAEVFTGKQWAVVSQEGGDNKYGYTPETTKHAEVETLVLQQNVDELDLPAVIKAINKL